MASPSSPLSPVPGQQSPDVDVHAHAGAGIPQALWDLRVPLHITRKAAPGAPGAPFITSVPRFSYLAQLLPRLSSFFATPCSSFHHEEVQMRNLPVGLLVDLYQPDLPWRLHADFVRNGNAKQIMSLSKEHTTALWNAVQDNDYASFSKVNSHLLNPPTQLKHVPIRIYVPSSPPDSSASGAASAAPASFRVLQSLVPPRSANRSPQTLGPVLRGLLPSLFPSSRDPVLANVVLHGAPVPFSAPLDELMREAAYPDGWLCLIITLL
ncbi:hypothetical protein KVR01_001582 [Diaporthe batatas]|uniref:uncharacterized protein n=1 Tax=Diaporthe batatas TaxID=748121 RepID=UPI001D052670|nr:uncharacterized protein KVR01_001582 [Diaporthe batatas]KAG8168833.1 hypothetical protein KVR01_001582 [Diaporthe batatas]